MSLAKQLLAARNDLLRNLTAETTALLQQSDACIRSLSAATGALRAGDFAPAFTLRDASGSAVALTDLLGRGPVVLSFYRGDWCPFCALELAALTAVHKEIDRLGASLVAISAQTPDTRCAGTLNLAPPFPLLVDPGLRVARRFRITFALPQPSRLLYEKLGVILPEEHAAGGWRLPIPATYVIEPSGRIVLSFLDLDYTSRLEPAEIVAALKSLQKRPVWADRPARRALPLKTLGHQPTKSQERQDARSPESINRSTDDTSS